MQLKPIAQNYREDIVSISQASRRSGQGENKHFTQKISEFDKNSMYQGENGGEYDSVKEII